MASHPLPADVRHAWAEIPRAESPKRPVTERVADFLEVYATLDEESAREQAMRCVQCPHPSCVEACPLGNHIPEWLALTAEGQFLEASRLFEATGCMGDVFSRLCSEPCEGQCVVDGPGAPVAIHAIERFLLAYGTAHGVVDPERAGSKGQTVAVMDAGPCGLACAHELARLGYKVRVYDPHVLPGGLLIQGAPAFKVDPHVVEHRLECLRKWGVEFRLGEECGAQVSLRQLREEHDAVFLGACAEEARPLRVPGADLSGVFQGVTFLLQQNHFPGLEVMKVPVQGRRVVVLGAGDTAMDCLRTAIRDGASEVLGIHRGGEDSVSAGATSFAEAREEGARFLFDTRVLEIRGEAGRVVSVACVPAAFGEEVREIPADVVLVAHGYEAALPQGIVDLDAVARDAEGRLCVDARLMTAVEGVFAGGTLIRGGARAVETVRDARRAAREIDQFLSRRRTTDRGLRSVSL